MILVNGFIKVILRSKKVSCNRKIVGNCKFVGKFPALYGSIDYAGRLRRYSCIEWLGVKKASRLMSLSLMVGAGKAAF